MSPRTRDLRAFLLEVRGRVQPEAFGFAGARRRRVAGLRRAEVAELIGVTEEWYARLETGRARFSLSALSRLAEVLALSARERSTLFALARPELASSEDVDQHVVGISGTGRALRGLGRRLRDASSSTEIAAHTVSTLRELHGPQSLSYWNSAGVDSGAFTFHSVAGIRAERLHNYVQRLDSIAHVLPTLLSGHIAEESHLEASPSEELRERIAMLDTRSYFGLAFMEHGRISHIFGTAWRRAHEASEAERFVLESVAAIAELALYQPAIS